MGLYEILLACLAQSKPALTPTELLCVTSTLCIIIMWFQDPRIPLLKKPATSQNRTCRDSLQIQGWQDPPPSLLISFERKTLEASWVPGVSDAPERTPSEGPRLDTKIMSLSPVVCFLLSSSFTPLIVFHPFSSDFLFISGTCCCVFVEGVVSPIASAVPPTSSWLTPVSLWWRHWVGCVLSTLIRHGACAWWLGMCVRACGLVCCVSLCLIEGALTPRGLGGPHFMLCNHQSILLIVGAQ